jgi:hypothetical protein
MAPNKMLAHKEELKSALQQGNLDPKSIYFFVDPPDAETIRLFRDWPRCVLVDGYIVYTKDDRFFNGANRVTCKQTDLYRFLTYYQQHTILIAAREYVAPVLLPPQVKDYFNQRGSQLPKLEFRGSYVGIIDRGRLALEKIDGRHPVRLDLQRGELLGQEKIRHDLQLISAGVLSGNKTSIKVAGVEHSRNRGGLNVVVLDKDGNVVISATFDLKTTNLLTLCTSD